MTQLLAESEFIQYGPAHLTVIGILIVASIVLPLTVRRMKSVKFQQAVRYGLAVLLLGVEWTSYVYFIKNEGFSSFIQNHLPLHACGMAVYLTVFMLITRNQLAFEIAYFWGLAGTTQAILTPALTYGFPSFRFFQFFITHSIIIVSVLVATFGMSMRPRFKGLCITYALTWALVFVVGGADYLLDANYMYLCRPPVGASPFYFLGWPWYILFQGVFAWVAFTLLWLPFGLTAKKAAH